MAAAENRVVMRAVFRELLRLGRELDETRWGKRFYCGNRRSYTTLISKGYYRSQRKTPNWREKSRHGLEISITEFLCSRQISVETLRSLRQGLEFEGKDAMGLGFEAIRCLSAAFLRGTH